MKFLSTTFAIIFSIGSLWANCDCTNCPLPVPDNTTVNSTIPIAGASNTTLGTAGQSVCQVCITLTSQAIRELDLTLTAPDGSSVILHTATGVLGSNNVTFDICFNDCGAAVNPDPGFLNVFSDNFGWIPNSTYTGSYYPANGACLSSFTGNVNGNWTLTATDDTFLDDHTITDWYIVFEDQSGLSCTNPGACSSLPACDAFAGNLIGSNGPYCQGDAILALEPTVDYGGITPPPTPEYSYTYIVGDAITDILIAVNPDVDLTTFGPGFYNICGLSYLTADAANIPSPGGGTTFSSVLGATLSGVFCGDVTNSCLQYEIVAPSTPDFDGPLLVCEGETVSYDIVNFDPTANYLFSVQSGSFQSFIPKPAGDGIDIVWNAGLPGKICLIEVNPACGDGEDCLDITVVPAPQVLIVGDPLECVGDQASYTISPSLGPGEIYTFNITGGSFVSFDGTTLTVQWDVAGTGVIEPTLTGGACDNTGFISVIVEANIPPPSFTVNAQYCLNESINITGGDNPSIINYIWTATNASISSTTNQATVVFDNLASVDICYQVETNCGLLPEQCQTVVVLAAPMPTITANLDFCDLSFVLDFTPSNGSNSYLWSFTGPGNAIFSDATLQNPSVTVDATGTYFFTVSESNGTCTEVATVEVEVTDGLLLTTPIINCDANEMYTVSFDLLDGQAPYTINGQLNSSGTFVSTPFSSGTSYTFTIIDDVGCDEVLSGSFTCPCGNDAGTMSTASIIACQDQVINTVAPIDAVFLTGDIGVFVLHDSATDVLGNILAINTLGTFIYDNSIILGQTYYISYVVGASLLSGDIDLLDPCLSVSFGQPIVFQELPTLSLLSATDFCGLDGLLEVDLSPSFSSILWQTSSGPGNLVFNNINSNLTSIQVDKTGTYIVEADLFNGLCTSQATVEINFLGDLEYSVSENCQLNATSYTVEIAILNGEPPYSSNVPGTFAGPVFLSDAILSGISYDIIISDNNTCESGPIQGVKLCDCETDAGSMDPILLEACIADDIDLTASSNQDLVLAQGDTFLYVLHTSSSPLLGDIKFSNTTGVFSYDSAILATDSIYYISVVAGNIDSQTILDFNDICLDVAVGQAVIWYSIPLIDIDPTIETCDKIVVLENRSNGGYWEILSKPSNSMPILSFVNADTSILETDQAGDYELQYTRSNGLCTASDTLQLTKNELPLLESFSVKCNDDLVSYSMTLNFINATDSYVVNGSQIIGNSYTQDNISSDGFISFTVTNQYGCLAVFNFGPVDCSCQTDAGTVTVSDTLRLCQEETLFADFSSLDFVLAEGDTFSYVIFDALPLSPSNAIRILGDSLVSYNLSYELGRPYYIAVVVADTSANLLDLTDPCVAISDPQIFLWLENDEINFSIEESYCEMANSSLVIEGISEYPVQFQFQNTQGDFFDVELIMENQSINFPSTMSNTIWTLVDVTGSCVNSFSGVVTIDVIEPLEIIIEDVVGQCNTVDFGSFLDLSSLLPSDTIDGFWDTASIPLQGTIADFTDTDPGVYLFSFNTIGLEDPCLGSSFSFTVTVVECVCPEPQFDGALTLCNGDDLSLKLEIDGVDDYNLTWEVIALGGQLVIPNIINEQLTYSNVDPGAYRLSFELDGTLEEGCDSLFFIDLSIDDFYSTGNSVELKDRCPDEGEINLFEYLDAYDTGGDWYQSGQLISNPYAITESVMNIYYKIAGEGVCPEDSTFINFSVYQFPEISVESQDISCFGADDGSIIITNDIGESFTTLTVDGLGLTDLAPDIYDVIYTSEIGCDTLLTDIMITEPAVVEVSLGDDILLTQEDSLLIEAIINISENQIEQIEWKDLTGVLSTESLALMIEIDNDNTVTIEIADENGCIAQDELNISLESLAPEVYLPNAVGQNQDNYFGVFADQAVLIKAMEIYDRWGNLVFQATDISSDSEEAKWRGYFKGEPLNPGVFVYQITLDFFGTTKVYQGDITLLR